MWCNKDVFELIMDVEFYTQILQWYLVPFVRANFADGTHCFMQDNNPKHKSCTAQNFFEANSINWWKTPPESPDLNPIENLWHELKEHLRARVKPHNKAE